MTATSRVQMFHLLYSRFREFVHWLLKDQEVAIKHIGVLGQNIFRIIGLKSCCLGKAAWSLACLAVRFFSTTSYNKICKLRKQKL